MNSEKLYENLEISSLEFKKRRSYRDILPLFFDLGDYYIRDRDALKFNKAMNCIFEFMSEEERATFAVLTFDYIGRRILMKNKEIEQNDVLKMTCFDSDYSKNGVINIKNRYDSNTEKATSLKMIIAKDIWDNSIDCENFKFGDETYKCCLIDGLTHNSERYAPNSTKYMYALNTKDDGDSVLDKILYEPPVGTKLKL